MRVSRVAVRMRSIRRTDLMGQATSRYAAAVVVDDERDRADLAAVLLEESGFRVVTATGADEALALLEDMNGEAALVFADLSPEHGDGARLARTIAQRWPWIDLLVSAAQPLPGAVPARAETMRHPWRPLDLLMAAGRVEHKM
jgi:CheY-like chemotaxis protein